MVLSFNNVVNKCAFQMKPLGGDINYLSSGYVFVKSQSDSSINPNMQQG